MADYLTSVDGRIVVVGAYVAGLTMRLPRFPIVGETVPASEFSVGPGGKGSNQAIGAVRLGADVEFVGCLGTDAYADDAVTLWEEEGIDHDYVTHISDTETGVAFILVNDEGENKLTVSFGANGRLSPAHVRDARETIADADILLTQLEIPTSTVREALTIAAEVDTTTVLNPAPARDLSDDLLSHVDYLTPNQTEARQLAGYSSDCDVDPSEIVDKLLDRGVGTVALTRGEAGALVATDDRRESVPAPMVDPVDSTGAGDAFNAGLAVGLLADKSIIEAVSFACHVGTYATTVHEVIPALPTAAELERFLSDGKN